MAKMRMARKSTKGKGKRWKKGTSSSSNPEHRKFRDSVKRGNLSSVKASGKLTQDLLAKHNAFEGRSRTNSECSDATDPGSIKTFDTFASGFSNCSNPSFDRLMKNWQSSSLLHKEMLAVLAAVAEVIKEKGGKETETQYFAALMLTLETVEKEESQSAVVGLIGMVIKRLPPSVLKMKFSEVSKVFVGLLGKYANTEHVSLLRSLIGCLSVLLRAQESAVWKNSSTLHIFNTILSFSTHPKPRVRKAGQQAVRSILKGSTLLSMESLQHPAAVTTAKFCILKIEEAGGSSQATTTLHVLGLLKDILGSFPRQEIKTACETLLRVMLLSSPLVKCCTLNALSGLFKSKPKQMTDELVAQLINALYDYQPGSNDNQSLVAWLTTMHLALLHLQSLNSKLCFDHTVKFFGSALDCCLSDKEDVINAVTAVLKDLLTSCVGPCIGHLGDAETLGRTNQTTLLKLVLFLENSLKYQFHAVWGNILQVMAIAFKTIGKQCHSLLTKVLQSLAELRDTHHFAYTSDLDRALGSAVRTMGPQTVLRAVPIDIHALGNDRFDFPRSWLIPVIRDNVQETKLQFFTEFFLPLANKLRAKVNQLEKENRKIEAKTVDTLHSQIWSMLPGFCTKPTDLKESFRVIAKTMGITLTEQPGLRLHILAAIRNLINKNAGNASNREELSRFAKNFLPILFNLYSNEANTSVENNVRLAVFDTIKVYLKVTDPNLSCELFEKAISRLEGGSVTAFNRHAVLDLSRALMLYTRAEHVLIIYNICKSFLQNEDRTLQKKAYRVMEEICQNENASCVQFVSENISELRQLLLSSITKANPSSKAPRLRCLTNIVSRLSKPNPEFMEALIPEAVLCVKESAEKARSAAFSLLLEIGRAQQRLSSNTDEAACIFMSRVMTGLAGNPHVMSATLSALAGLFYHFRGQLSTEMTESIIENVCLLLEAKCREVVQSALAFIKSLFDVLDVEDLAQYLPSLVKGITSSSDDCQRHFRFKVKVLMTRLVRKFGYEIISKLVPVSHQKVLANIRKTEARKARAKSNQSKSDEEDDADDRHKPSDDIDAVLHDLSSDESETEQKVRKTLKGKRRNKTSAYIEEAGEEIVDFMDHKVSQKITAVRPSEKGQSETKHNFKTAPDGRLIITDNDQDENKKRKQSDETMDYLMEAAEFAKKGQKRKRSAESDDEQLEPALHPGDRKGIHRKNPRNTQDGASYKAKKARGDLKKKDKHDPYAYFPLDRQALNKRKKAKFSKQFQNVVRGAKKGAAKGAKFKGKRNRK